MAAVALMVGFSHIAAAAPITSNWTPGNAGNWSGGAGADAVNWSHSQPPTAPSTQTFPGNNASDTYAVTIGGGAGSSVNLNVSATIDSLQVDSGDTLNVDNARLLSLVAGGNVTNNGAINVNSTGSVTGLNFQGSSTISGSGTITLGNGTNNRIGQSNTAGIVTHAAGHTIRGAGSVLLNVGGFNNAGSIIADQATALVIDPGVQDFNNTGTLRAQDGAELRLQGGVFNNAGGVIEADGPGSNVNLANVGTLVNGGTLASTNGGEIRSGVGTGAILNGVTIAAGSTVAQSNSADFRVQGGVTNNGTWELNSTGSQTHIQFLGTQTIGGTGAIVMGNNIQNNILVGNNADVLTLVSTQTIRGAGRLLLNAGGFINNGAIRQQGSVEMTIDPGTADLGGGINFINNGTLRSEGTGGLSLFGGNYQNAGQTIETTGGGDIRLANNAIVLHGGDLTTSGGGAIRSTAGTGAILDNVRLTSGSDIVQVNAEDIRIRNGIINDGTWSLNSTGATTDIQFLGSQTVGGTGEIVMSDNLQNRIFLSSNADTLTVGADQTIRGAGRFLLNAGAAVNQGTIVADRAVNSIIIDAGTNFSNQGILRASGAAGFDIRGSSEFTQAGGLVDIQAGSRIDMTFGDYVQTGGHTQVDGTLATSSIGSNVNVQGGTFGGTGLVDFNGTGVHALNNTGGMITAGASPGTLTIQDGNFVQGAGGTFEFELDGFVAGVGHDLLNIVNGDADLGGNLSIVADQLFASTLSIGDQFEVVRLDPLGTFIDGDLIGGADLFDNIIINLAGLNFSQLFIGNSLFIEVTQANVQPPGGGDPIPEPESMILMMLGLTAILWMRRRRVTIH